MNTPRAGCNSSQPRRSKRAWSPGLSSTVVVSDSTIAGPSRDWSGRQAGEGMHLDDPPAVQVRAPFPRAHPWIGCLGASGQRGEQARHRQPRIDRHRRAVAQGVGEQGLMAAVECIVQLLEEIRPVEIERVERHGDFGNLFAVAHVGAPPHGDLAGEPGQPSATLPLHRGEGRVAGRMSPVCASLRESSSRRSVFSIPQADSTAPASGTNAADAELRGDGGDVQAGGAAEGQQREADGGRRRAGPWRRAARPPCAR